MDPVTAAALISTGGSAIYDLATQGKQYKQQRELMDIQFRNQQALNIQGQKLGMKTWEETNYPAQVQMLKKAGLNPGLLYSKGGTGGTTSTPSGGGAASASAPSFKGANFMGIMEMQMMKAQIDNINADTANKKSTNPLIGAQTAEIYATIEKLKAETTSTEAKTRLTEVETGLVEIEKANKQYLLDAEIGNILENTRALRQSNDIQQESMDEIIKETKGRYLEQSARIEATKANITLTKTETQAITTGIVQKWTELGMEGRALDQKDRELAIRTFEAEIKANFPSIGSVAGQMASRMYESIKRIDSQITGNGYEGFTVPK